MPFLKGQGRCRWSAISLYEKGFSLLEFYACRHGPCFSFAVPFNFSFSFHENHFSLCVCLYFRLSCTCIGFLYLSRSLSRVNIFPPCSIFVLVSDTGCLSWMSLVMWLFAPINPCIIYMRCCYSAYICIPRGLRAFIYPLCSGISIVMSVTHSF